MPGRFADLPGTSYVWELPDGWKVVQVAKRTA